MNNAAVRLRRALGWTGAATAVGALARLTAGEGGSRDAMRTLISHIPFDRIEDTLMLDYVLNTFVNKIPFPEVRMELYRAAGMDVHETTNIMMHAFVLQARDVHIGPNCIIGPFATLDGRATLTIGRNVNIAGEVLTIGGHHAVDSSTAEGLLGEVVIEDNAWVAMRATILPGVTIHEGAYVAAGAVVTRDVEPYILAAGVPARKIRDRSRNIEYTLHHFPRWI
jgi:acetyltransferase-like isoleucine patch superfamily enzyme